MKRKEYALKGGNKSVSCKESSVGISPSSSSPRMKKSQCLITGLVLCTCTMLLFGCHGTSPVGPPSVLSASDIVFSRDGCLYIMKDEDSLKLVPLLCHDSAQVIGPFMWPKLSPDRRLVAFYGTKSFADLRGIICVIGVDGKGLKYLATVSLPDEQYQVGINWSPDGRKIAFSSAKEGTSNIYIVNADGTGERKIADDQSDMRPGWSSDGRCLAFQRTPRPPAGYSVVVCDVSGSMMSALPPWSAGFSWSPVDNQLVFTAVTDSTTSNSLEHVYMTNVGNSSLSSPIDITSNIYPNTRIIIWGGWNPSGNGVLVRCLSDSAEPWGIARIVSVNPRNGEFRLITTLSNAVRATWSQDGGRIFFTEWGANKQTFDAFDLYVMNSDGSGQRLLIRGICDPDW